MLLLTFFFILTVYLVWKWKKLAKYWDERGAKYVVLSECLGDLYKLVTCSMNFTDLLSKLYDAYPEERYCGFFQVTKPILLVRDPELIKQIAIKNFDSFVDHDLLFSAESDPMWSRNLFASKGERWRGLRQAMSPIFTGSKMRFMFTLMDECAQQLSDYFKVKDGTGVIEIEMKDVSTRYMNDMIASTALGVKCNSLKDRENEFYVHGRDVSNLSGFKTKFKIMLTGIFPTLGKWLKITIISPKTAEFYKAVVLESLKLREQNKIVRPDLLHMLMEARKGKLKYEERSDLPETGFATVQESDVGKGKSGNEENFLTDDDITAQALIFYLGGFDTSSALASFTAYELAINPEIQSRLRESISEATRDEEKLTYEKLMAIKYLDMVISEILRKWPQAPFLDRKCTRDFTIQPERPGEKPLKLKKGDACWMAVYGIHMDPKYYPNPEKFDPERFSDENKVNITGTTYIPFGIGPRNCIGNRFALLENKILFFYLLRDFEIVPTAKTPIPMKLSKSNLTPTAEADFHLGLKRIR